MFCPNAVFSGQIPATHALTSVLENGSGHNMQLAGGGGAAREDPESGAAVPAEEELGFLSRSLPQLAIPILSFPVAGATHHTNSG